MSKQALGAIGIALLIVAVVVGTILTTTRKNRLELSGDILKVRSHQADPERTIALVDLRVSNPSTQQFVVKEVEVFVEEADGKSTPGELFTEIDARRVVEYYATLGGKYTPGLLRRDKINSGETVDRSLTVSLPMSDERLGQRKAFRIVVHDIDGKSTQILEKR